MSRPPQSRDAVAAFNPTERHPGKTIVAFVREDLGRASGSALLVVAFWIVAIVLTVFRLRNLAGLARDNSRIFLRECRRREEVSRLVNKGYDREYRIKDGHLFDLALNSRLDPRDIRVDTALRLESGPDAGDASNVHSKGLLIDAFDIFDEICDRGLAERLVENRDTEFVEDSDAPSRYGLRKVYKNEFDRDPEHYVLRIGYPDFPECPLVSRSRCSASIRLSKHMFGSSQAYSGIHD